MPIEYAGKKYRFNSLVNKIKRTKPEISNPNGYVAAIEKRQHKQAQLMSKLQKLAKEIEENKGSSIKIANDEGGKDIEKKKKKLNFEEQSSGSHVIDPDYERSIGAAVDTKFKPEIFNRESLGTDEEKADIQKKKLDRTFAQTKQNVKIPIKPL